MERDYISELRNVLVGRTCRVVRSEGNWRLEFGDKTFISLYWPWRVVSEQRVTFASDDDGQWFGLGRPLDGVEEANRLIRSGTVRSCSINEHTGDLELLFDGDVSLQAFTMSSGYEGWHAYWSANGESWVAVVLGGGDFAVYPGS
jgi:hypothetical protein